MEGWQENFVVVKANLVHREDYGVGKGTRTFGKTNQFSEKFKLNSWRRENGKGLLERFNEYLRELINTIFSYTVEPF